MEKIIIFVHSDSWVFFVVGIKMLLLDDDDIENSEERMKEMDMYKVDRSVWMVKVVLVASIVVVVYKYQIPVENYNISWLFLLWEAWRMLDDNQK